MGDGVQDPNVTEQANTTDTSMETPEKLDKGKGKAAAEQDPMDEDEDESEEDEEVSSVLVANPKLVLPVSHRMMAKVSSRKS